MPSRHLPAHPIRGLSVLHAHVDHAPERRDVGTSGAQWAKRYRAILQGSDTIIIAAVVLSFQAVSAPWASDALDGILLVGIVSAATAGAWLLALAAYRTRDTRVLGLGVVEYKLVAHASAVAFGILAILFLVFRVDVPREFFFAAPVGLCSLLLERWLWRKWLLHQRTFGHYLARAIVVGGADDVAYVIAQVAANSGAVYRIVGAAVDDPETAMLTVGEQRIPILATRDGVARAAVIENVDAVIVAGQPDEGGEFVRRLGWDLEGTPAELVLSSRLTDVAGPRIHFRPVDGLPLMHVETPTFAGSRHVLKRSVDIVLAAAALVVLLPLLLAIAVAVRLDSPGPALFRQRRCSRNGSEFQMLKFRSMVQDAEDDLARLRDRNEGSGVLFKLRDDPRVTRVGRTLRKYSLDELPQIWNVLVGDMSIVGPRPPLVSEVACYEGMVRRRLYIKPGMTGLWQISGRSDLSWEESVRLDLYYVENWSLTGDLMIMWRTAKSLVKPKGAY